MAQTIAATGNRHTRGFTVWGLICLAIAVVAFWPSYTAPLLDGSYVNPSPMMHWHVLSAYLWTALIVAQPGLVLQKRMDLHRLFGVFGVAVAVAVVVTGTISQIDVMGPYAAQEDIRNAVALPYFRLRALLIYTVCVATAVALVRRPDWHKRLMILATLALLGAAYNRIFMNHLDMPRFAGPGAALSTIALMICFLVWDRIAHRRFHPVSLWGTIGLSVLQIVTTPVVFSGWWRNIAAALAGAAV